MGFFWVFDNHYGGGRCVVIFSIISTQWVWYRIDPRSGSWNCEGWWRIRGIKGERSLRNVHRCRWHSDRNSYWTIRCSWYRQRYDITDVQDGNLSNGYDASLTVESGKECVPTVTVVAGHTELMTYPSMLTGLGLTRWDIWKKKEKKGSLFSYMCN